MAVSVFGRTQFASQVPFDNTSNGFVATDTQAAIEEVTAASNATRFMVLSGFDGTASTGRFLEFITNIPSNTTPFIMARAGSIKELSLGCSVNSTGTVQVLKNGSLITSISLTAAKKNSVTGLSLSLAALDEISVKVSSGSIPKPIMFIFLQTS